MFYSDLVGGRIPVSPRSCLLDDIVCQRDNGRFAFFQPTFSIPMHLLHTFYVYEPLCCSISLRLYNKPTALVIGTLLYEPMHA